jgi:hypothetical protein
MVEVKRWQKVSIWLVSIAIVLGVGGLFAANYAVDKVLNSMVGMSLDDVLGEEAGDAASEDTTSPSNSGGNTETDGANAVIDNDSTATDGDLPVSNSGNNSDQTDSNANEERGDGAGQSGSKGSNDYAAEVSTDKAKEVEENITLSEKAKVVSVLMSSLSASDISTLQKLASGGLTVEEKREAKELLLSKLTEDQYNELIAIAAKHGLSKGQTYAESKK